MSLAVAAPQIDIKGKQAQRLTANPHHPASSGELEHDQRVYHQRMVEHVRNNALENLNSNIFHQAILSPSAYPAHGMLDEASISHGVDPRDRSPVAPANQRSDTDSTVTSASLPSPGPAFGGADLGQIAFDPCNSLPRSSSTGGTSLGDHSLSMDKFSQPMGASMPYVMGNNPGYHNLLDSSACPTAPLYNSATHAASLMFGNLATKSPQIDTRLGLALDMPSNDNLTYSTFDALTYPYGVPGTGAFGYTGMYTATPFSGPSSLPTEGQSINPGYLHAPPPMTASSSHGSRVSLDDHDARGRQDMWDFPASPLHSVSPSPSPIEAAPRTGGVRRSSESAIADGALGRGKRGHKRKMTWSSGMANEGPNVSQAQKEQELRELERLEQGGAATRRERRRLQNRLAQRAFRARSKLQNNAAATHLTDLEELADVQAEQLSHMQEALDKLQAENLQLRADRWKAAKGDGTNALLGPDARRSSTSRSNNSTAIKS